MSLAPDNFQDFQPSSAYKPDPRPKVIPMKTQPQEYGPFISTRRPLSRRHFLRGTGIALALPFLDTMAPTFARAAQAGSPLAPDAKPRRMFAICQNLGVLPDLFFPANAGRD